MKKFYLLEINYSLNKSTSGGAECEQRLSESEPVPHKICNSGADSFIIKFHIPNNDLGLLVGVGHCRS